MAQTTKYHISYLDEDNQSVYDLTSDIPKYDKQQALSIEAALESIDLTEAVGDLNNLETTVKSSIVAAINELKGDEANVGSLGDLETTVKTSIVAAINEINGKADDIGDLTNLETTIKTSIVAAINELKGNITTLQNNDATFATAINMKISSTEKGSNNGVAQLDSNGKVPSSQLPSYVDDIIEGYYNEGKFYTDSAHTTEITGEEGKIYVDLVTNKTYRWSSTIFVEISESLALGETSSTAYRGDKGKEAYDRGIQNKKDINELGNILYTKKELTSTNNQVSFTGNENLEFSITEIDGKTSQDTTNGYQLIHQASFGTFTDNGITFTQLTDGGIKVNGTASADADVNLLTGNKSVINNDNNVLIEANQNYVFSGNPNGDVNTISLVIHTQSYGNVVRGIGNPNVFSFTADVDISAVRIIVKSGVTINNMILYPMLEKGSTAHTFEKYTGEQVSPNSDYKQDVKVVTGENKVRLRSKNLLDESTLAQGAWHGSSTKRLFFYSNYYLKAGTYTLITNLNTSAYRYTISLGTTTFPQPSGQTIDVYDSGWQTSSYKTFTITQDGYLGVGVKDANEGVIAPSDISSYNFMIYEGEYNSSTTYEPYYLLEKPLSLGNMELAQIGNYKDKIYKNLTNNKWYLHKEFDKKLLLSTMCNSVTASASYGTLCYLNFAGKVEDSSICAVSNKFIGVSYDDRTSIPTGYRIFTAAGSGAVTIRFPNTSDIDTLEEVKNFVDNNEIIAYYLLATAIETEITDTTLISQLEAIQKLQQITGTNIVEIVSTEGNLNPEFKIEIETDTISYIKDNFVKNTDYATSSKGGVVKVNSQYGLALLEDGTLRGVIADYTTYGVRSNNFAISKGTLENVLNARIGDISTILQELDTGSGV